MSYPDEAELDDEVCANCIDEEDNDDDPELSVDVGGGSWSESAGAAASFGWIPVGVSRSEDWLDSDGMT